jgi:hypothetical protein
MTEILPVAIATAAEKLAHEGLGDLLGSPLTGARIADDGGADAVRSRAVPSSQRGGIFNVTDAEPVVLDDALRETLAERHLGASPLYLPLRAVLPLAALAEGAFLLANSSRPPRLTRYAIGHLAVERTLDITAARRDLGYAPAATSFRGAARW